MSQAEQVGQVIAKRSERTISSVGGHLYSAICLSTSRIVIDSGTGLQKDHLLVSIGPKWMGAFWLTTNTLSPAREINPKFS